MIGDAIGFIYLIENIDTGRLYIGKKLFKFQVKRKLKNRVNRKISQKVSDWKDYYGSCKALHKDLELIGKEKFKRKILKLCYDKFDLSYSELEEQMNRRVLFDNKYYNEYIGVRLKKKVSK